MTQPTAGYGIAGAQSPAPPDFAAGATSQAGQNAKSIAQAGQGVQGAMTSFGNGNGGTGQVFQAVSNLGRSVRDANAPSYGGYTGGANDYAAYTQGLAEQAATRQAPAIDWTNTDASRAAAQSGLAGESASLGALDTSARGGGPGETVAGLGLNMNTNASTLAGLQAAGAGRDAASRSAASTGAVGATSGAVGAAAAQAGAQRAAAAQQAQAAYQQGAEGLSRGELAQQGADWGQSMGAANLAERQNQINQQGEIAFLGAGQQAQAEQLDAQAQQYAANVGQYTAAQKLAAEQQSAYIGAGLGAASGIGNAIATSERNKDNGGGDYGDVRMREPGGGSGWTLREEPDFLLARNDRTGELRKLATEPLSKSEHAQAMAPHGAGPIGSGIGRVVADLGIGGQQQRQPAMTTMARTKQTNAAPSPSTGGPGPQGPSGGGQDPQSPTGDSSSGDQLGFNPGNSTGNTSQPVGNGYGDGVQAGQVDPYVPPETPSQKPSGPGWSPPVTGVGGNALAYYGGNPGGANQTAGFDMQQGQYLAGQMAPAINSENPRQDWLAGQRALDQQQQGLGLLQQTAAGQGAAIDAAKGQVAQGTQAAVNSANTVAASASGGGRGLAAAHGAASLQNAQAQGTGAQQQQLVAAQMQQSAQQQLPAAEAGYAQAALGLQGQESQQALDAAGLAQQQQALGQSGQAQMLGLANTAENAQLQAGTSQYGVGLTAQQQQAALAQQQQNQLISGAMGIGTGLLAAAV